MLSISTKINFVFLSDILNDGGWTVNIICISVFLYYFVRFDIYIYYDIYVFADLLTWFDNW